MIPSLLVYTYVKMSAVDCYHNLLNPVSILHSTTQLSKEKSVVKNVKLFDYLHDSHYCMNLLVMLPD